jgi:HK97 family phage prohead protease
MASAPARIRVPEVKTYGFVELKTEGDAGNFSGYASTYNRDLQNDRIEPGAFGKTIAQHKGQVPLLFGHDDGRMIGASTALAEDGKGLFMQGKLALNTSDGSDAYGLLKLAADIGYRMGMSIGFIAEDFDWDASTNSRLLKEIDLWEISLTPFPAQPKAYVGDVKTHRDFEMHLREVGRFSQAEAKRIMRLYSECNQSDRNGRLPDASGYGSVLREFARAPWKVE